jgi:hypothetical protein
MINEEAFFLPRIQLTEAKQEVMDKFVSSLEAFAPESSDEGDVQKAEG